ncbi:hypothetical protein JCM10207_008517 [Rhodosporidiobolus poonsookiae]
MVAAETRFCAVCQQLTTKRCSACRTTYFCSLDHQKILWPAHEWLCQARRDFLTLPPLKDDEVKVVRWRSKWDKAFLGKIETGMTSLDWLRELKLHEGTIKKLLHDLRQPKIDDSLAEPARSLLLICLRETVYRTEAAVSGSAYRPAFWQHFSHAVYPLILPDVKTEEPPLLSGPFSSLHEGNAFFSRLLLLFALAAQPKPSLNSLQIFREVLAAAQQDLDGLFFNPTQADHAQGVLDEFKRAT